MDYTGWILTAAWGIGAVVVIVLTFNRRYLRWSAERLGYAVGLSLPAELAPRVARRVALRQRGVAIGGLFGLAATAALLQTVDTDPRSSSSFVVLGGLFTGIAIGTAIASSRYSSPVDAGAVRYARSSAVAVRDYLPPMERIGARVAVALGLLSIPLVAGSAGSPSAIPVPIVATLSGGAVVALVLFEVVSRRIVDRPQFAESPDELAWDDALRASLLRDVVTAPLALGAYAFFIGALSRFDTWSANLAPSNALATIGALALVCIGLVVAAASALQKPRQYYLRRLWSADTAHGGHR
jgi:hypothetical protein